MIIFRRKLNKKSFNWTVFALIGCLSLVVLLGSPFHDHDLDPSNVHNDCIACHLVHSNDALETATPELYLPTLGNHWIGATTFVWIASAPVTNSSRAPPVIC